MTTLDNNPEDNTRWQPPDDNPPDDNRHLK
jgi:hypothetical protein